MFDHERAHELALIPATDLDPAERDWLADHLDACDSCRAFVSDSAAAAVASADAAAATAAAERSAVDDKLPTPDSDVAARPHAAQRPLARRLAFPEPLRRRAVVVTAVAVAVTIVAGGLFWNSAPRTDGKVAGASLPARTTSPDSSDAADPWASLDPSSSFEPMAGEDPTPSALLTARGADGVVVPLDAGFRLASIDATPASRLAARLTVEPAFAFSIRPDADDRAVFLTPKTPLLPGIVYRFALSGPSGELLDTWAFQARQPLRIVGTLPENQATDVPLDTGIEMTFDQDGVADAASHVTVTPATPGRFEQHGRTLAFIPNRGLVPATIYRVVVTRGVKVASTGEATATDTRFQFETATTKDITGLTTFEFQDQVVESATTERPTMGLWGGAFDQENPSPKTTPIEVYRLANLDAAITAFRAIRARPDWSSWSTDGLVDTSRLTRVVAMDAPLNKYNDSFFIRLPSRLPVGWYLVQQTSGIRPIQVVLQVTDVAGYLAVSDTRTVVWANDLKTGGPIVGATASSDGVAIGKTDDHGLAIGHTPRSLLPQPLDECDHPCDPVVTVRTADGRSIFLPAATPQDKGEGFGDSYYWYAADSSYWSLLHTDRNRYRRTDTVNLWGVVRDRDTGKTPAAVTVRLTLQSNGGPDRPAVASLSLKPGSTGAFHASIPLTAQPEGSYTLAVLLDDTVVRSADIVVGPIAKPAYRLEITTGRRVYIAGDRIKITANAAFFEGTPVPGVPLRIDGFVERSVTTDASGTATYLTTAKAEPEQEGPNSTSVAASPATAEEGEIASVSRELVIFPSTRTIDANASIASGRVRVTGSVHVVAVDRLEKRIAGGQSPWELDPRAAAVAGATVTARFVELIPHRRQTGTQYDFIEKKVVPVYEETITERSAGTVQVKTASNGTYKVSIPATVADHDYRIVVSVADAAGLVARITTYGNRHPWNSYEGQSASLHLTTARPNADETFSIGDRVDLTMTDPATGQTGGDGTRYLFFVAQRGIHNATVQASPRFSTTFQRWAAPNIDIGGVRFTGRGYVGTVSFVAQFRTADRRLQIDLSSDAARYRPGETATVRVRTRTAAGAPVAATVTLRAVDEKLFSMGFAQADDPLGELYSLVESGIVGTYQSHRNPRIDSGDGGDTTGGGGDDRDDFRDSLLFQTITTGADGRGTVSFKISDDLTSWRVTASGITSRLDVGSSSVLVPVGLPFFVDASIAPEYLVADRPTISVRTFGSDLKTGDAVTVQVTSKSLGFDSGPIRSTAFATIGVPLPSLSEGLETLTISATTGSGTTARTDRLTRSFAVVTTRLLRTRTNYVELPFSGVFGGGDGLTTVVVSDASAGRYLSLLNELASSSSARLDARLAAEVARSLLVSRYGSAASSFDPTAFDSHRYQGPDDGIALLPYSSSELELSALVAIVAPDRVERSRLGAYLRAVLADRAETRERQMFALAGLAGLGDPVLAAIRTAAADPALTIRERLMIGLGAAALGDATTARSISSALISEHGERLGGQARLRVGSSSADITSATALMAVLGAALGDPRATQFWAYVEANPAPDRLEALTAVAHVANTLEHLAVQPATFAYTVDGTRSVVDLEPGETFEVGLTAAQLASLTIDRIAGSVGVATTWREPVRPAALVTDPDVTLSRSVSPSSVGSADLVRVELTIKFGPQTAAGCHQVTELVPSGLAPMGSLAGWVDPDSEQPPEPGLVLPYDQSGSRVFFCAEPTPSQRILVLRYYARVITPGTYAWEPAIAESRSQDGRAALTPATTITVR